MRITTLSKISTFLLLLTVALQGCGRHAATSYQPQVTPVTNTQTISPSGTQEEPTSAEVPEENVPEEKIPGTIYQNADLYISSPVIQPTQNTVFLEFTVTNRTEYPISFYPYSAALNQEMLTGNFQPGSPVELKPESSGLVSIDISNKAVDQFMSDRIENWENWKEKEKEENNKNLTEESSEEKTTEESEETESATDTSSETAEGTSAETEESDAEEESTENPYSMTYENFLKTLTPEEIAAMTEEEFQKRYEETEKEVHTFNTEDFLKALSFEFRYQMGGKIYSTGVIHEGELETKDAAGRQVFIDEKIEIVNPGAIKTENSDVKQRRYLIYNNSDEDLTFSLAEYSGETGSVDYYVVNKDLVTDMIIFPGYYTELRISIPAFTEENTASFMITADEDSITESRNQYHKEIPIIVFEK